MRASLVPKVVVGLRKALRKAGTREIGGMLFAEQIAPGKFRIVDFSLDPNVGSPTFFTRDPAAHQDALSTFFEKTGGDFARFNYLGEWHSHPSFPVHPSLDDVRTMTDLVERSRKGITFALLLIVRLRFHCWLDYSMTCFAKGYAPVAVDTSPRIRWN